MRTKGTGERARVPRPLRAGALAAIAVVTAGSSRTLLVPRSFSLRVGLDNWSPGGMGGLEPCNVTAEEPINEVELSLLLSSLLMCGGNERWYRVPVCISGREHQPDCGISFQTLLEYSCFIIIHRSKYRNNKKTKNCVDKTYFEVHTIRSTYECSVLERSPEDPLCVDIDREYRRFIFALVYR